MSEYRIISNGQHFCVQKKMLWLFWRCPDEGGPMGNMCYNLLDTREEAEEYMSELKNRESNCNRKWTTLG